MAGQVPADGLGERQPRERPGWAAGASALVGWLQKRIREPQLLEKTESMSKLIDSTVQTVRKIATGLRPEMLDDMGLVAAIAWQTTQFQKRAGVRCKSSLPSETVTFDKDLSTTMFRIYQELLTNVARHAQATRLDVELRTVDDRLVLKVSDNGVGIVAGDANGKTSLGLLGMRERALRLGGSVDISSARGSGTQVAVSIPMGSPEPGV